MWDWFNIRHRRRSRRSPQNISTTQNPDLLSNMNLTNINFSAQHLLRWFPSHSSWFPSSISMLPHTPKCLGSISCSEVLTGTRVEDFSQDCWLEDHLHSFGYVPQLQNETHNESPTDDLDDDSITGSGRSSFRSSDLEVNSDSLSFEDSLSDYYHILNGGPFRYEHMTEPPPYDCPTEPPPSYEEAIRQSESRSNRSSRSSSDIAFLW